MTEAFPFFFLHLLYLANREKFLQETNKMTSFVNSVGVDSRMDLLVNLLGCNVSATFMLLASRVGKNDVSLFILLRKREKRSNVSSEEPKNNSNGAFQ